MQVVAEPGWGGGGVREYWVRVGERMVGPDPGGEAYTPGAT